MSRTITVAVAQLRPRKGDYRANVERVAGVVAALCEASPRPHVVHFPETVLSGYFVEGGAREVAVTAGTLAEDLDEALRLAGQGSAAGSRPIDVIVGFYERWRETLHNSVAYLRLGDGAPRVVHVHRKAFLPTYGLFDEERFVERGHDFRAFDTPWGRAALLICEDAWHSMTSTIVALDNAEVIFISTATPARGVAGDEPVPGPANAARWERLARDIADEHGVFVTLANLVGSEGGKVFAGCSCVFGPRGDLRARGPAWQEAAMLATLDLSDIGRARADIPLLSDLRTGLPHLRLALDQVGSGGVRPPLEFDRAATRSARATDRAASNAGAPPAFKNSAAGGTRPNHPVPVRIIPPREDAGTPPPLDIDAPLVETWLVRFLSDELERRNMRQVVVGISGGVDSAVTAYLAARALGAGNVLGAMLPYRT